MECLCRASGPLRGSGDAGLRDGSWGESGVGWVGGSEDGVHGRGHWWVPGVSHAVDRRGHDFSIGVVPIGDSSDFEEVGGGDGCAAGAVGVESRSLRTRLASHDRHGSPATETLGVFTDREAPDDEFLALEVVVSSEQRDAGDLRAPRESKRWRLASESAVVRGFVW